MSATKTKKDLQIFAAMRRRLHNEQLANVARSERRPAPDPLYVKEREKQLNRSASMSVAPIRNKQTRYVIGDTDES